MVYSSGGSFEKSVKTAILRMTGKNIFIVIQSEAKNLSGFEHSKRLKYSDVKYMHAEIATHTACARNDG